jgi:hypothetical protein
MAQYDGYEDVNGINTVGDRGYDAIYGDLSSPSAQSIREAIEDSRRGRRNDNEPSHWEVNGYGLQPKPYGPSDEAIEKGLAEKRRALKEYYEQLAHKVYLEEKAKAQAEYAKGKDAKQVLLDMPVEDSILKSIYTPAIVELTSKVMDLPTSVPVVNDIIGIGGGPTRATTLPTDGAERKQYPVATGVLDYFPDAIAAISYLSWKGNDQHNPGLPLHWARHKSTDEADTLMRHFLQRGTLDSDGIRHSVKVAWRALAMLQRELEAEAEAA